MADEQTPTSTPELGKEDIIELLGEDQQEETLDLTQKTATEGDEGEVGDEGDDELKEIEKELEEPKEEDELELITPVRRKEILAKYPNVFKDFPQLEKAYYRDQQYTELLPTVQDARIAVEKSQVLDQVEARISSGDITPILQAAKNENSDSFFKIADNYLGALRQVDQQVYYHVLGNVIKDTIITLVREGKSMGDQQGSPLIAAANILNQFVFGSNNFQPPTTLSKTPRPEDASREQEIQNRERNLFTQHFESTRDDLQNRADNVLKATIDGHIDPKKTMSDYVRGKASQDAFSALEDLMDKDTRFHSLLDRLWQKAFEKKFDKESTDRIKAAYLSKAKTLLPSVIKQARNQALRGSSTSSSNGRENVEPTTKKGPIPPGRSTTQPSGKIRNPKDIPKGMKTIDFLMQD